LNTPGVGDHVAEKKGRPWWRKLFAKATRDVVIFSTGIVGIVHEIFFANTDRPTLIILFGAMIGLPAFLHFDENRTKVDESRTKGVQ
jgi:hypothetical protein